MVTAIVSSGFGAGEVGGPSVGPVELEGSSLIGAAVVVRGVGLGGRHSIPGPTMDFKSSSGNMAMLGAQFVRTSVYSPKKQRWRVHCQQFQSHWHPKNRIEI